MSVINQMLRDLDERVEAAGTSANDAVVPAVMRGTVSVRAKEVGAHRARRVWCALALAATLLVAGAVLFTRGGAPVTAPVHVAAFQAPVAGPVTSPVRVLETSPPTQISAPPPAQPTQVAALHKPPLAAAPHVTRHADTAVAAAVIPAPPAVAADAPAVVARPPAAVAEPAPDWSQALRSSVAQAQDLWGSGSREPAAELLREALAVLERTHPQALATPRQPLAVALVRELARMELALGRPDATLLLLRRHQPLVNDLPDMWAVRGNAAQRAGEHEEAVTAYQAALRLRPGEPRWMLGAAVSLAALGQLDAAAQWANQAAAISALDPAVLGYLRGRGVPVQNQAH